MFPTSNVSMTVIRQVANNPNILNNLCIMLSFLTKGKIKAPERRDKHAIKAFIEGTKQYDKNKKISVRNLTEEGFTRDDIDKMMDMETMIYMKKGIIH